MKSFTLICTLCLILTTSFAQKTLIHCGKLVDVKAGKLLAEMTIVIDGEKIEAVNKGYTTPEGEDNIINLKNLTVLPGLMDMHVHLEGEMDKKNYVNRYTQNPPDIAFKSVKFAEITLMSGFTTVRDLGGSGVNTAMRDAIKRGDLVGPRVFSAGKAISITGGHGDPTNGFRKDLMGDPGPEQGVVNGVNDCRKAVRQRYKNGADLIKITATGGVLSVAKDGTGPHMTEEEIRAVCETAQDLGMQVAAHAHGDEGMQRAIRGGVTSIEHGTLMSFETMELMKQHSTWYVPTITAGKSVEDSAKIKDYFPDVVTQKALMIGPKIHETFGKAYKKGVKIAYGTDAGVFRHGKNAIEFTFMVEAGMPPMEAIQSATLSAAELLGVEKSLGQITPGYIADIIAVEGNPIEDISILQNVKFVMKEGKVYKQ